MRQDNTRFGYYCSIALHLTITVAAIVSVLMQSIFKQENQEPLKPFEMVEPAPEQPEMPQQQQETLPEIAHEINIVNLTSEEQNRGLLDPYVIMDNPKDSESLAIDILTRNRNPNPRPTRLPRPLRSRNLRPNRSRSRSRPKKSRFPSLPKKIRAKRDRTMCSRDPRRR